jgi:hypothetical protein
MSSMGSRSFLGVRPNRIEGQISSPFVLKTLVLYLERSAKQLGFAFSDRRASDTAV